jgi:5S rRNA maturation endonuclease (ribonuclease M5)
MLIVLRGIHLLGGDIPALTLVLLVSPSYTLPSPSTISIQTHDSWRLMFRPSHRWGTLPQLQLPPSMMKRGVLSLPAAALKVLVVLLHLHKSRTKQRRPDETIASVKALQAVLKKRTGYTRAATISEAVQGLQEAGFVQIVWDRTGSTKRGGVSSEYILTDPDTHEPLPVQPGKSNVLGSLKLPYFTIPTCLLTSDADWSWTNLSGPEVRLYIALLWIAYRERSNTFERTRGQMYTIADLSPQTFKKALDGLERHRLIVVNESDRTNAVVIDLCDPLTGEPVHTPDIDERNDPANYKTPEGRRFSWNDGTDEEWEQMVRDAVTTGEPITKRPDGELMIRCPYHDDQTPSCSVSLRKRCYNCFGCGAKGNLRALLAKLKGSSEADIIPYIARGLDKEAEFRDPDSEAIAKYYYIDASGVPLKKVLRHPNDAQGNKVFRQRKWTPSGWRAGVKGVGPVLYNAHRIPAAGTVIIVEGEKDADTVTNLHLRGCGGETIGVTSGGRGSWHPKLAKQLRDKVVIVMPDNDAPGEAYAEAVRASLDAERIKYKTVSFAGTGAKDVTEYLTNGHTAEELVQLIDSDWVRMSSG